MAQELVSQLPPERPIPAPDIVATMDTATGLELIQRQARLFANSSLVPDQYRIGATIKEKGKEVIVSAERAIANCSIAISMAIRLRVDPMSVLQNMFVIQGKPSFGAPFMIGLFNKTGKFSSISYTPVGERGKDSYGMVASCIRLMDNEKIEGPEVTIGLAKREGWFSKPGSKWLTMPDLMLRYRAAAFLIRTLCPEVCLGLLTQEEAMDIVDVESRVVMSSQMKRPSQPITPKNNAALPPPQTQRSTQQTQHAQPQSAPTQRQTTQVTQQDPTRSAPQRPTSTPFVAPRAAQQNSPQAMPRPQDGVQDTPPAQEPQPTQSDSVQEAQDTQTEQAHQVLDTDGETIFCPVTERNRDILDCDFCPQKPSCPAR